MGSVPLALASLVLQTAAGTLQVSDLARVYARHTEVSDGTLIDVENTPRLALGLAWPTARLDAEYAPRLLWADVFGVGPVRNSLLHTAGVRLVWRQPRDIVSLSQTVAVGEQDFSTLGATGVALQPGAAAPMAAPQPVPGSDAPRPPELDLVPRAAVLDVAAEQTSASLRHTWSRRIASELGAAFGFSGGADAVAQRFLPQQRAAEVDAAFELRRSPRDELTTGLSLAQIHTSNGYDHWLASLIESWSARWAHSSGGEIGAGAAFQDTTGPAGLTTRKWVPVGTASAWHALLLHALQARLQWNVGYRPDVNVLSGAMQSRLFTSLQASLIAARSSVAVTLATAQTYPRDAPEATEVISADLVFEHELLDWLSMQLGGQVMRQELAADTAVAPADARWSLYGGLLGRLPEARF